VIRFRDLGSSRTSRVAFVALVGCALLAAHAYYYWPFIIDDALISLRYSERLLEGHGLTWSDGDRVEGYSNLLWVLACAAVGATGIDLISSMRLVSAGCAGAVIVAIAAQRPPRDWSWRELSAPLVGVAILASSGAMAVWAVGGLEAPMVGALLAWSCVATFQLVETYCEEPTELRRWQRVLPAGILMGLLSLTRPDAFLFVPCIAGMVAVVLRLDWRALATAIRLGVVPSLFVAGQLTFRKLYYDDWIPNTARAKVSWTDARLEEGWTYVTDGMWILWPALLLAAPALVAVIRWWPARRRVLILLPALVVWLAYQIPIGGDIFAGWRHLLEAVVLVAMLATEAAAWVRQLSKPVRYLHGWAAVALSGTLLLLQLRDERNQYGVGERWELDGLIVGPFVERHFRHLDPLVGVDSAGCVPYWNKLRSLDLLGLNDRYLGLHPPETLGTDLIGHELGDADYFLRRSPDVYHFGIPSDHGHAKFPASREMVTRPEFTENYQRVVMIAPGEPTLPVRWWVKTESRRVGVQRTEGLVIVPGYLLAQGPAAAREDATGNLAVVIRQNQPGTLNLHLPAGTWRPELDWRGIPPVIRLGAGGPALPPPQASLAVGEAGKTAIHVTSSGPGLTYVYELRLHRDPQPSPR
jgi:arabinofuranosyltransferase